MTAVTLTTAVIIMALEADAHHHVAVLYIVILVLAPESCACIMPGGVIFMTVQI